MIGSIIIAFFSCLGLILSVLFFPKIRIRKIKISTYWVIVLIGAIFMILFNLIDIEKVIEGLTKKNSINPLKILCLFISMTILSIFLDEIGFFKHIANIVVKKAGKKQIKLFIYFYILTSILTIFTSNDIIILTFTPFICYFSKNAKINPIPYLVSEFIAANTWSMMLIIGNPTNIYIGETFNIGFLEYVKVMLLPTLTAGIVSFGILFLIFKKELKKELSVEVLEDVHEDKVLLILGLTHLGLCTILLAISSYINLEMWYITLSFAVSLLTIVSIYKLIRKENDLEVHKTIKRAPWALIPFIISMFIIVLSLDNNGVTDILANFMDGSLKVMKYGVYSFFSSNLINNIPMSLLFSNIINESDISIIKSLAFPTIIGSNIGAFLTPIGALAGIMWMSILRKQEVKMTFLDFTKYGILIGLPTIVLSLFTLYLVL